jgi:phage terminase large subunit
VWLGEPLGLSDAQVFKNKFEVQLFETPQNIQFYFGADWGFAQDPTTLIRCFVQNKCLYIDYEAYGVGVEIEDIPKLFDSIPNSKQWRIYADSARPETISYVSRNGYPKLMSVKKWAGSIEDGIEFMRSFDKIIIHPRCKHTIDEFELYSYKQDRLTGDILPIILDKSNHCVDSIRYSLVDHVQNRNQTNGAWRKSLSI